MFAMFSKTNIIDISDLQISYLPCFQQQVAIVVWQDVFKEYRFKNGQLDDISQMLADLFVLKHEFGKGIGLNVYYGINTHKNDTLLHSDQRNYFPTIEKRIKYVPRVPRPEKFSQEFWDSMSNYDLRAFIQFKSKHIYVNYN